MKKYKRNKFKSLFSTVFALILTMQIVITANAAVAY